MRNAGEMDAGDKRGEGRRKHVDENTTSRNARGGGGSAATPITGQTDSGQLSVFGSWLYRDGDGGPTYPSRLVDRIHAAVRRGESGRRRDHLREGAGGSACGIGGAASGAGGAGFVGDRRFVERGIGRDPVDPAGSCD